ncbi:SafA/ExsA family spore coat assembly protein, partial [Staphylococcus sp. SIMBA_130]
AAFAASSYTVVPGDTMWKIALKTQTGVSEIIKANAQLKNPNLIYPGQSLRIPTNSDDLVEQEVIKLVNAERAKVGLP